MRLGMRGARLGEYGERPIDSAKTGNVHDRTGEQAQEQQFQTGGYDESDGK